MARQRKLYTRRPPAFPEDFPRRLEQFKEVSKLSWGELAELLGTTPLRLRRWRRGVRPSREYIIALLELADDLGLTRLLINTDKVLEDG